MFLIKKLQKHFIVIFRAGDGGGRGWEVKSLCGVLLKAFQIYYRISPTEKPIRVSHTCEKIEEIY